LHGQCIVVATVSVGLWLLTPSSARAGGFEVAQQGASAAGTASAGTARSGEPVAAWFNPAALADGKGFRAGLGVALAFPSIEATAADGSWKRRTEFGISTPAYVYASYAHAKWALGLAANIPFASGIRWPGDWEARFESVRSQPQFFRLAPFFSYRLGPVRLGGGVHVDIARVATYKALDFVDTEGSVNLLLSGVGVGGHFSVFWRINKWVDLGVTYKSRTLLKLSGDADFTVPDSFASRAPDQTARADFTLPDRIALGGLAHLGKFTVLLDVVVTLWMTYDKLVVNFENEETDPSIVYNGWGPSVAVRTGVEYAPLRWLTARAGLYFDQSPIPAENLYPSSPDSNRLGATLGVDFRVGKSFSIDLFYDFVAFLGNESTSDRATLAAYAGTAHYVGLGLRLFVPTGQPTP